MPTVLQTTAGRICARERRLKTVALRAHVGFIAQDDVLVAGESSARVAHNYVAVARKARGIDVRFVVVSKIFGTKVTPRRCHYYEFFVAVFDNRKCG